jgi:putative Holliday junction resolvase
MKTCRFLGFDYGEKIIGVAVGSTHSGLAEPLTALPGGRRLDWTQLDRLIETWRPEALVVGLPLNMDGSPNEMTAAARRFKNRLKARYNLPVHMVDERLTTRVAAAVLHEAGVPGRRHKRRLDKLAAQAILQAFLHEQRARPTYER